MGKQSTTTVAFNDDGWGDASQGFTKLAAQIVESVHQFEKLEAMAMEYSRANTHALESLTTLQNVMDEPDEWALLIDNYHSDDDSVSSAGKQQRELQELQTSSLDIQDIGRDFSFSLCAVPLSDSCPKISEWGKWRIRVKVRVVLRVEL